MHRHRFATLALLLIPLALIYSCDDKIATEPTPVSPAPESLFEWSLNWVDVGLVGKPMLTRIGDGITLPLRGAFDIVKVSPDGEELWRQAYDTDYYTASSDNVYGFVATGRTQFNETRFIESVTGDGTPESRLVLDGAVPSALAVLRASEFISRLRRSSQRRFARTHPLSRNDLPTGCDGKRDCL